MLDTGADGGHADLQGRPLGGKSFVDASATTDSGGHGTATTGLIGAATNNGVGLAGVTWGGQTLLPVKVLGTDGGSTSVIAQGLNYAVAQGAKVINMSFGVEGNPGDPALDSALNTAAQSAVLVAAAGNTSGDGVYYPASNPNVIPAVVPRSSHTSRETATSLSLLSNRALSHGRSKLNVTILTNGSIIVK